MHKINNQQESQLSSDFIWYLSGTWETDHRRHMILSFAKTLKSGSIILCINRPIFLLPLKFSQIKKLFKLLFQRNTLSKVSDNIYIYTPILCIHDQIALYFRYFALLNKNLLRFYLKKILRHIGCKSSYKLSWIYIPTQKDYIGAAGETAYIYERFDDYKEFSFPLMDRALVKEYDQKITKNAIVVFNTAQKLFEESKLLNSKSYYIPNGTTIELFKEAQIKDIIPGDMQKIRHPIVGFIGNMHNKFIDFEIIQYIISLYPIYSFVVIGNLYSKDIADSITNKTNVYYLGYKKYEEIPFYIRQFDIGIIPFKINALTESLNPLKLYEFMAGGCPVVANDIPELRPFKSLIKIAKNKVEFGSFIREIIEHDNTSLKEILQKEAMNHTWDKRVADMIFAIKEALNANQHCTMS